MSNDPHVGPVEAAVGLVEVVDDAPAAGAIPSVTRQRHPHMLLQITSPVLTFPHRPNSLQLELQNGAHYAVLLLPVD